jgi:hypothetical protein
MTAAFDQAQARQQIDTCEERREHLRQELSRNLTITEEGVELWNVLQERPGGFRHWPA